MHAVQREASLREPLLQVRDRGRIVIVDVRPGGEDLHGLESLGSYLDEVIPTESLVMIQVSRNSEQALARQGVASF